MFPPAVLYPSFATPSSCTTQTTYNLLFPGNIASRVLSPTGIVGSIVASGLRYDELVLSADGTRVLRAAHARPGGPPYPDHTAEDPSRHHQYRSAPILRTMHDSWDVADPYNKGCVRSFLVSELVVPAGTSTSTAGTYCGKAADGVPPSLLVRAESKSSTTSTFDESRSVLQPPETVFVKLPNLCRSMTSPRQGGSPMAGPFNVSERGMWLAFAAKEGVGRLFRIVLTTVGDKHWSLVYIHIR